MNLLIGALTIGLILALLALGVYITFRIFGFPDITVDGSITLGAAVCAILLVRGVDPLTATLAAAGVGAIAGLITGILHTVFHINGLLSGILVMTGLYSVNLHVMGRSNIPLLNERTLVTWADGLTHRIFGDATFVNLLGWRVPPGDLVFLVGVLLFILAVMGLLYWFFRTDLGTAMRATGDNPQMIRALGTNTGLMITIGLAISNGLVGLAGGVLAQYQGFADVQMGIGMVVWGLAAVIIGESLVRTRQLALALIGAIMGSVLFRLLIAIALRFGLNPNDLKITTSIFVFVALVLPMYIHRMKQRGRRKAYAEA
ncbi:MAG: ABC transporter permease [Candidatus Sumerlaeia bacterium]|nr:ABC transporter permease [Candidatus Sumerlaeia bacterium]